MNLSELAANIGAVLDGDGSLQITSVGSLAEATGEEVSFFINASHAAELERTAAAAVIVPSDFSGQTPVALLRVDSVEDAIEQVLVLFADRQEVPTGIAPSADIAAGAKLGRNVAVGPCAVIGDGVVVGDGTIIGPGCVLGEAVTIGRNCRLWPNVVVYRRCSLGDNVVINAGSIIGTDGFGYRLLDGSHCKIPHIGTVEIEDDVEIGASSCIDRAKFDKTVIGRGSKIDNLVQIAHNVRLGRNCIVVSQAGIAGSSRLGDYVVLGGQVGIGDHVEIGEGANVGAQSGIFQDIEPGGRVVGTPSRPVKSFFRECSLIQKLPQMAKQLKQLKQKVDDLSEPNDNR